jgi:hypothetical protein
MLKTAYARVESIEAGPGMKRSEFIRFIGGAAAWPLAAHSEQAIPVIGFVGLETSDVFATRLREFRKGLNEQAMSRAIM